MASFDSYKARVNQRGDTERERTLYYEKEHLKTLAVNSLSCKDCQVNGVDQKLIIDDGTLPYYKDVKSLPDEYFNAGDYITWADCKWLVVSCDWDKEVYTYGKAQQCNYLLKWQDETATTIERWSVVLSASKYNNGEKYNNIIVVGSNQLMVYLPNDADCLKLKANKRLMVDFDTSEPRCYDITRVDTVTMSYDGVAEPAYDGKGCILLILTETEFNPDVDRADLMLCDYVANPVQPTSPILITYAGNPELRIGGRKTFTAVTEAPVTFSLICAAMWEGKITMTQTDNKCVVKCANDSAMAGAVSFKIKAMGGGQTTELLVNIIGAV